MDESESLEKDLDNLLAVSKAAVQRALNEEALCHLPKDVTAEEIKSEMQQLNGHSIVVYLVQADGNRYSVVVPSTNTRICDLKKCIQRQVNVQMQRKGLQKSLSWKYIWKAYTLSFEGMKITNENAFLNELGIESQCEITFAKKLKEKVRIR